MSKTRYLVFYGSLRELHQAEIYNEYQFERRVAMPGCGPNLIHAFVDDFNNRAYTALFVPIEVNAAWRVHAYPDHPVEVVFIGCEDVPESVINQAKARVMQRRIEV